MKELPKMVTGILSFTVAAIIISSCSATRVATQDNSAFRYNFVKGQEYAYVQESNIEQYVYFGGQELGATILTTTGFTLVPGDKSKDIYPVTVTVDTVGVSISSPQFSNKEPITSVIGKSFDMKMSDKGDEEGLEEADKIKYMIAGTQEVSLKTTFMKMFPDMPDMPVTIGQVWTDTDSIDLSTANDNAQMIMTSTLTYSGNEKYQGYECARITYTMEGTRSGSSNTADGQMFTEGNVTGNGYMLFAPAEGLLLLDSAEAKFEGSISIPSGDILPMDMVTRFTLSLVK